MALGIVRIILNYVGGDACAVCESGAKFVKTYRVRSSESWFYVPILGLGSENLGQ